MRQPNNKLEQYEEEYVLRDGEVELGDDHAGAVSGDEDQGEQDVGHYSPPLLSSGLLMSYNKFKYTRTSWIRAAILSSPHSENVSLALMFCLAICLLCHLGIFNTSDEEDTRGEDEENEGEQRTNNSWQE